MNITHKILNTHLQSGQLIAQGEISIKIDQTLTQDATGTMAWLQFENIGIDEVKTELSMSYVDHNTLQMGFRNADDHLFLQTIAAKYGAIFSPASMGICHQLHLENFAKPGKTLLGSDSHTPTAGGMACLAIGAGGLSVALAMAGQAYTLSCPSVVQVWLENKLQGWASAKDIILHILSIKSVKGGVGKVFEYAGPGLASLSVPERATITNMGAELGATTSIFPSDERTQEFLMAQGRGEDYIPLAADPDATYDEKMYIDLSTIVPLAAKPHMPDNVVPVSELIGLKVNQVAIGSCTNSSYADLHLVSSILKGKKINPKTDTMISPGSKQVLSMLADNGILSTILLSGARLLECSCGPCIGMGGAPISAGISVRTFNRNFEGRSGTKDAKAYLVSPATAANVAINGEFTDPSTWGTPPEKTVLPKNVPSIRHLFVSPPTDKKSVVVKRGPNIIPIAKFAALPSTLTAHVVIKLEDNITTDHIMPASAEIIALRSNIPAISAYVFNSVDADFVKNTQKHENSIIIAGENYGQGSSREHAALAPRHLGIRVVLALSLARIHRDNLINFGILPLTFVNKDDYDLILNDAKITFESANLIADQEFYIEVEGLGKIKVQHKLSAKQCTIIKCGGLLNYVQQSATI